MDAEALKKRVERYKALMAAKIKAGAPAERIRLFHNKLKMFQRRLGKIQKPAAKGAEGAKAGEAAPEKKKEKK